MARRRQDLLGKLTDPFEEALQKLGHMPGTQQFVKAATGMRDRVDDLAKRIGRLDELEQRVKDLEKRVNQMSGGKRAPARTSRASGGAKRTTRAAKSTGRKTTGSRGSGTTQRRRSSS
ncbi:MAG: hypothetical protein M3R70_01050 [Actinomycetota bacterium]|nr:hypothetical protein [Actinomycetota bacterium]